MATGTHIEIIYPDSHREKYLAKGQRRAGSLATYLAKQKGLDVKKKRWQLRGPLGVLHPQAVMRNVDLQIGECLKLEEKPT